ncbi:hypothetical protein GE09DRAFT_1221697 [Coniochaeta sp. 2T2.1]|nr:hypothetical protein GE09DRAFT_1221697 [Coniochaeta sp. 2T2.1]
MDQDVITPRRRASARPRGRASGARTGPRTSRRAPSPAPDTEPPPKRRKYIPGGPGGGGRFIDENGVEIAGPSTTPRRRNTSLAGSASAVVPTRERSSRIRTAVHREDPEEPQLSSAAAVAAAVVHNEGYKPREERGWEEFHPNLDIEATFMVFRAEEVDGAPQNPQPPQGSEAPVNGTGAPSKDGAIPPADATSSPKPQGKPSLEGVMFSTPPRRRPGRPPKDPVAFYAAQAQAGLTPKTPKVLPIHNQTPKERLDLKLPSYRRTDRISLFDQGRARYVDKSMMNVGYQESDNYIRPERNLIKASDSNVDEETEPSRATKTDGESAAPPVQHPAGLVGRVEYDMDEQDDMWLEKLNAQRKAADISHITPEIFEITITKIEKEWHALEKRIPKPNPKPPQTHRPRSSSAAAVNGEPQAGEEQDSKCAICDDGDCENTNAIVFCDGCDLAVHQECYGVPFIPEGQWLCRKCQLIGRGIPTCIFCPNTDGAFKQTTSSKWAHLLCAMWIPEVSLGNHTFMEPVMEVEKVPKNRWRLSCYICNQRMGACIQCSNKNCYQAFHVTCARRGRLYLKMKNSQGALAFLDGNTQLKAFCDAHCPPDYSKENEVAQATREAKKFYKRTMKGRIWADSQASAVQLAATHRHAITEHPPDESQMTGAKVTAVLAYDKKKGQPAKPIWKLPSGAPIIPQAVFDAVENSLQRFMIQKRKEFVADACRYWTLKREARRGAALLKRLQLQMETFSSMELTRRNFAAMGPSGKARLTRRIEFAEQLVKDLEQLQALSEDVVKREVAKLESAEMEKDFVDTVYFPVYTLLVPVIEKALLLDKNVFSKGLVKLQEKLDRRFYTTTLAFAHDFCEVINVGINTGTRAQANESQPEGVELSPAKHSTYAETRDRKRLGKRMLKSIQPLLQAAAQAEADITSKPVDTLLEELDGMVDASLEMRQPAAVPAVEEDVVAEENQDVPMHDVVEEGETIVALHSTQASVEPTPAAAAEPESEPAADADADAGPKANLDAEAEAEIDDDMDAVDLIKTEPSADVNGNAMDMDTEPAAKEASPEAAEPQAVADKPDDPPASSHTPPASEQPTAPEQEPLPAPAPELKLPNGLPTGSPPPSIDGYSSHPAAGTHTSSGPLTPPQSNGSLGHAPKEASGDDFLSEGGIPWYFSGGGSDGTSSDLEVRGTSVVETIRPPPLQPPPPERAETPPSRTMSEELSEMDDETLMDLGIDVNDHSITASPVAAADLALPGGRKGRANPARFRKGVRSSARRR